MVREPISKEFWTWQYKDSSLGSIAIAAAVDVTLMQDSSRLQGCRVSQVRWNLEWANKTSGHGPIYYGMSWDLGSTQVAACMEGDPQSDSEVNMELVRRNVIVLGFISKASTGSSGGTEWQQPGSF